MTRQPHNRISGAQQERDAALVRIARARRATIVGAGGLTVGRAAFVSAIAPGHSLGAKVVATKLSADANTTGATPARATSRSRTSALRMPSLASPSQLGLQRPDGAPQPAPTQQSTPTQQAAPSQPSQPAPVQQSAPVQQAPVSGGS
jgi:hypothetical protein